MKANLRIDSLTKRVREFRMEAQTFEEQRILALLAVAVTVGDSLFEVTLSDGETTSFKMIDPSKMEPEG